MPETFSLDTVQKLYPEYNVSEYIDSGGSKQVFKGRFRDEDIVVKLLPVESRHRLRRAEREARAMEIIDSEIFVELKEHFIDEIPDEDLTVFVIIEELIQGETLEDIIGRGDADIDLGINVLTALLTVLEQFNKNNIVHRDIKPSNIMMSSSEKIKLLDVGIARFTKKRSLTATGADTAPGTHGYRAPEQIKNKKEEQDIRTDLFSTGIVMFEAITGEHPFDHGQDDLSDAILEGQRKDLKEYIGESELVPIYEKLTEPELHKRYRKPSHAKQELEIVMGEI